jgi:hypothetical protein
MQIRLVKKRIGTTLTATLTFKAYSDEEAADLRKVVLALRHAGNIEALTEVTEVIEDLGKLGYAGELLKETRNTKEFQLSKAT